MKQLAIDQELRQLIVRELGVPPDQIHADSSLFHDLNADGLDGADFMEAYSRRFGVDMSEFDFTKHFGPELPFFPPLYIYRRLFAPARLRVTPIRFAHLVACAQTGNWISPDEAPVAAFEWHRR